MSTIGECTFRAAAFWRLLYQVWKYTKRDCPEAFPIGNLFDKDWTKEPRHLETLAAMIVDMNCGTSARSGFLTYDEIILADAVLTVVRAFSGMPDLLEKLETDILEKLVGETSDYVISRNTEIVDLAKKIHAISLSTDTVVFPTATLHISHDETCELTFHVKGT